MRMIYIRKPFFVNMNFWFKQSVEDGLQSDKSRLREFNIRLTENLWNKIPKLHHGAKRLQCNLDFINKIERRFSISLPLSLV